MFRSILRGLSRRNPLAARRSQVQINSLALVESLEARVLLSANEIVTPNYSMTPNSTSGPTGLSPAQIKQAYGFNNIMFNNGTVAGDGSGTTIAIVDAYNDPNIASDLHQFDLQYGLPDPIFTKVSQTGSTTALPSNDAGWAGEIALDVEWAHAIAPKANILLVEANSSSMSDLMTAVDYARHYSGVVAVSMSWGGSEFSTEKNYDSYFTTPANHVGVSFFVSSGDNGAPIEYPAASVNVISVGGTTLNTTTGGVYQSESAWSGSGGGISSYETQPNYQKGVVTQSTTKRTNPDVSYDADPNTGFSVYNSFGTTSGKPWEQYGGTSDAAPQWAGLAAIVAQGRALAGLGSLDGATQLLPMLYSLPASDFHDVTSGSSTGTPTETAVAGYDLATGRGTPYANKVVADLVGSSTSGTSTTNPVVTHFSITTTPVTTSAGTSFSITVSALDSSNNLVTGYTGTVHFTTSDGQGTVPANYTFTSADKGVHTFSGVVLKTAGTRTVTVTDTSNSSLSGTLSMTVTPGAVNHLVWLQQPTTAGVGSAISPAVTVELVDAYNNVVTTDNTDTVSITLGTNPSGASLSGTTSVKVVNGIATFSNLSLNQAGNGYTLVAHEGALPAITSGAFNVGVTNRVIEGFESGYFSNYYYVGGYYPTANITLGARHDGTFGMSDYSGSDWIYRNDSTVHVKQGDTISVWLEFNGSASGVAAFGFGASANGTLSIAASPMSNQLMLVNDAGYGAVTLGAVNQTFLPNHWYRLEVDWSTSGAIIGRLFDSNGTTQLQTVTGSTNVITNGGIAFKANGANVNWDTVQLTPGVNTFAKAALATSGHPANLTTSQTRSVTSLLSDILTNFGLSKTNTSTSPTSPLDQLFQELTTLWSAALRGKLETSNPQTAALVQTALKEFSGSELDELFSHL